MLTTPHSLASSSTRSRPRPPSLASSSGISHGRAHGAASAAGLARPTGTPGARRRGARRSWSPTPISSIPSATARRTATGLRACSTAFVTSSLVSRTASPAAAWSSSQRSNVRRVQRRAPPTLPGAGGNCLASTRHTPSPSFAQLRPDPTGSQFPDGTTFTPRWGTSMLGAVFPDHGSLDALALPSPRGQRRFAFHGRHAGHSPAAAGRDPTLGGWPERASSGAVRASARAANPPFGGGDFRAPVLDDHAHLMACCPSPAPVVADPPAARAARAFRAAGPRPTSVVRTADSWPRSRARTAAG